MSKGWCGRHYLSYRTLVHADSIRNQLSTIMCKRLNVNIGLSCKPTKEPFLQCLCAGLFMNVARKVTAETATQQVTRSDATGLKKQFMDLVDPANNSKFKFSRGGSNVSIGDTKAPYKTLRGGDNVFIHPTSVLFSMHPKKLPDYILFVELLITAKQYVRILSCIDDKWLHVVAPHIYANTNASIPRAIDSSPSANDSGKREANTRSGSFGESTSTAKKFRCV